jgi:hypothetical protein
MMLQSSHGNCIALTSVMRRFRWKFHNAVELRLAKCNK